MSWAEVKKINSNLEEPLNFFNYIYDISTFGDNSYVLQPMNKNMWTSLVKSSYYLFGHKPIQELIYKHLYDDVIDTLFEESAIVGQQINAFLNKQAYPLGDISDVIFGLNLESYVGLPEKFQLAYNRYVNKKQTAQGVGKWFNEIFKLNNPSLNNLNTIEEIINDGVALDIIAANEPALVALTYSKNSMEALVNSQKAIDFLVKNISIASQSEVTVRAVINNSEIMEVIVNNKVAMDNICTNKNSFMTLLESEIATHEILQSDVALTSISANIIAFEALCEFFSQIQISRDALEAILTDLNSIETELPKVYKSYTSTQSLLYAKNSIQEATKQIDYSTSGMRILLNMVEVVLKNETLREKVLSNENVVKAAVNSSVAMSVIVNDSELMSRIVKDSELMSIIINSNAVCAEISTKIQSYRSELINTLKSAKNFTKKTLVIGNGAGTFDSELGTNSIYIPTYCRDDNDTGYVAYHGCDVSKAFVTVRSHSGVVAVNFGVGLRGVRLIGTGNTSGDMTFDVYTAI